MSNVLGKMKGMNRLASPIVVSPNLGYNKIRGIDRLRNSLWLDRGSVVGCLEGVVQRVSSVYGASVCIH